MTEIDDLVQEFWSTSRYGAVGVSLFAMRRLLEILQECLEVCFDIIAVIGTAVDLADNFFYRCPFIPGTIPSGHVRSLTKPDSVPNLKY